MFSDPNDIPVGWVPGAVDPISSDAIVNFWNAGVQLFPPARQQFSTQGVSPPTIYWQVVDPVNHVYQLTGGGAYLGPMNMFVRGTVP